MKIEQAWVPLFFKFLEYMRINSKETVAEDDRGSPLVLWRSQKMAMKAIIKGLEQGKHQFMFLKSRQLGVSTVIEALDIFWLAYFSGITGCYVSDSGKNIEVVREKITRFVRSFPDGFFGRGFSITANNMQFIRFSNGNRLDFLIGGSGKNENWGESRGYNLIHSSETAKYGSLAGINNFLESFSQTHPNRLLILESTSKGMNHWRELYEEYRTNQFTKACAFMGWWAKELNAIKKDDPRYQYFGVAEPDGEEQKLIDAVKREHNYTVTREQLAWYRQEFSDKTKSIQDLNQNQPWTAEQSFICTGSSFFDMGTLNQERALVNPVPYKGFRYLIGEDFFGVMMEEIREEKRKHEITLRIWEDPDDEGSYAIGCDPSYGRGELKDSSCIEVWRCFGEKMVQVAEWADNSVETKKQAWVLAHLAGAYRKCVVIVEAAAGMGGVLMNELENLRQRVQVDPRFENLARDNPSWEDFLFTARWYLYKKYDHFGGGHVKGWESNFKTKGQIMSQMHDKHTCGQLVINSRLLVDEMMAVVRNGDKIEAPAPLHDDRVIATALAIRAWVDDLMMPLLTSQDTYEAYIRKLNGIPLSMGEKFVNGIIRAYMKNSEERADNPVPDPLDEWRYNNGFSIGGR